jgi:hypothetical protein
MSELTFVKEFDFIMQIISVIGELVHFLGAVGWAIAILLIIFLFYRKPPLWTARIYAIGSWITFGVMRFPYGYFYIFLEELNINWDSPFALLGLIGGYGLMAASLIQYWLDRKM